MFTCNEIYAIRNSCLTLLFIIGTKIDLISQEVKSPQPLKYEEVTIPNTELRTIWSQNVNQEFKIFVQLPPNYFADSTTIYPVLYVTDANRSFPMVANISSILTIPKQDLPEIVVIGIGYSIKDMADWAAWRTRDLTPTNDTSTDRYWNSLLTKMGHRKFDVRSGGASNFLKFIVTELIPFVEVNYRVFHSERGLAGYSYGGLFCLYAMFTQPEIFNRYYVGSPSLEYDNHAIFKYERDFETTQKVLKAKIFFSVGALEDSSTVTGVKQLSERLRSRYRTSAQVSLQIFDDENHRSCMAAAIMRAFRVLYKQ